MTTTLPDANLALGRVSELYRHNVGQLGTQDVVIASHGGAGQSLIGNILFELGLNYVDAYTERLAADGRAVAAAAHTGYREHLAAQHGKDRDAGDGSITVWPRFVKTHHPPVVFGQAPMRAIWVLVRDPRDAIYASYQWRDRFAEEVWDKVPGTLLDWLRGPGDFSDSPVADWPAFYRAWSERASRCDQVEVLRFEDLKRTPVDVVAGALARLGVQRDRGEIERAVEASSFANMRAHEDQVASAGPDGRRDARIVRAGKTNGWQDWMTEPLAGYFADPALHEMAAQYGYHLPEAR